MFTTLRNHFGIPGVVAVIALIFAMLGGAYAASSPNGGKATASAKGKRGKQGKPGKTGPAGPMGPAGAKGDAGAPGANGFQGAPGKDGTNGIAGTNGKSVTVTEAEEFECEERGGAIVEEEGEPLSVVEVCNGEKGSPWTAGGKLPAGATETGGWAFTGSDADTTIVAPISFALPLVEELFAAHVHYQPSLSEESALEEFEEACPGGVSLPEANPGELCVYYNGFGGAPINATFSRISPLHILEESGTSSAGAVVQFAFSGGAGETALGSGSWAVTGCSFTAGDPNECPS